MLSTTGHGYPYDSDKCANPLHPEHELALFVDARRALVRTGGTVRHEGTQADRLH